MSNPGQPTGQLAYQSVVAKTMQNALACFAKTANRYGSGSIAWQNAAGSTSPQSPVPIGCRHWGTKFMPAVGNANVLGAGAIQVAGTGYVVNDLITLAAQNGGRAIILKVTSTGGGGSVTGFSVQDPGSGIPEGADGTNRVPPVGNSATIAQASTSGVGINFSVQFALQATGWTYPEPNPAA